MRVGARALAYLTVDGTPCGGLTLVLTGAGAERKRVCAGRQVVALGRLGCLTRSASLFSHPHEFVGAEQALAVEPVADQRAAHACTVVDAHG